MSEILKDLEAVRAQRKRAEDREAHFRAQREQLELEEVALVQLVALARLGKNNEHPRQGAFAIDPEQVLAMTKSTVDAVLISNTANGRGKSRMMAVEVKRPASKRAAILDVMRNHPEHERWTTSEIRGRLAAQGIEASTNLIGVTLRRMAERGDVLRDEDNRKFFKLPPDGEAKSMGAG